MIIEFSIGNFRSIKDVQSINLTTAKIKELAGTNTININDKISVLKSKAIYGANASGKSNFIKALVSFIRIIKQSVKDDNILRYIERFQLSNETEEMPSFFQLIFISNNIQYRFGFEATNEKITSEWLYGMPNEREVCFFIRENNEIKEISKKHYNEGSKILNFFGEDNEIFRNNSLFLSAVSAMNGKLSKQIIEDITSITVLSGLSDRELFNVAGTALDDDNQKIKIVDFLKLADTGINTLDLIELSKETVVEDAPTELLESIEQGNKIGLILSSHDKYSEKKKVGIQKLHFQSTQSEGTIKMFELSPFLLRALNNGETLFIDEFDARFHPLITKKIVELFNSKNNSKAQLIFVTHDTNLLSPELLRRDQIEFVEKDKYGESHMYTLVQFKGIRNNASFEKDYIEGRYGAIPFLGDFNKLFNSVKNA
jgi:AAA15 family ATPase/GTPase